MITPQQRKFLAGYVVTGRITGAAEIAGCAKIRHYEWMQKPEYQEAFAEAYKQAVANVEEEIHRRAIEGDDEPVIYQGKRCYEMVRGPKGKMSKKPLTIRRRNDILLMFLAKGLNPEKWRENAKVELGGPGGGPLQVELIFREPRSSAGQSQG